ncbi:hypothetical protein FQN55_008497 [Onygenales sp. PD_40]|nr:hypothetical protein FQN55_008497 [Onygenales sp. PD_40]
MHGDWGSSLALPQNCASFSFSFSLSAMPAMPTRFSFARPLSPLYTEPRQTKRSRPVTDVDGEGSNALQKKKRRLRVVFITSRLSRPFSSPATHIVGRGSSKIAVWAKQKALGRNLLRKAAIMNRIRKHVIAIRSNNPLQFDVVRQMTIFFSRSNAPIAPFTAPPPTPDHFPDKPAECRRAPTSPSGLRNEHLPLPADIPYNPPSPPTSPRRQYIPLPRSPLDLGSYDIFDNEDGYFDSDSDSESESCDGKSSRIYSDFNVLEPSEPVVDDHDAIASFDSLSFGAQWLLTDTLKEDEKSVGIQLEKQRQKEVSFVQFGF